MNIKPRLHQPLAFNLIAALVIAVFFGARPGVAQSPDPSEVGQWSTGPTWPEFPVHAHVLKTGKVMMSPRDTGPFGQQSTIMGSRDWKQFNPALPGRDLFCSGHSFLADGKLFVAGGHNGKWPWTGQRKYL